MGGDERFDERRDDVDGQHVVAGELIMDVFVDSFRAMGTAVEVTVVGGEPSLLAVASGRIAELERRWSRFVPSSEICRLNRAGGAPTLVSPETFTLIEHAQAGFDLTQGRFDALQLEALEDLGYRESFERLGPVIVAPRKSVRAPRRMEIDADTQTVSLPDSARFDPGGIGKGFAADLVTAELRSLGAAGVCVNVGGDVRVTGVAPRGDAWVVAVRDSADDEPVAFLSVADGAVATTSRSRRRWTSADGAQHHHIVDPATGQSAATPVVHATAIASEGWRAEILAKVAFLDRVEGIELAERCGATAMVATAEGLITGASWVRFASPMEVSV